MFYRLLYLISYLLFREKCVLIIKGGLSGVRYQTPKTWSESCETKFISVRPKYLSDRGKIYIFRISSPRAFLRIFFRFFVFSLLHGPSWKLLTLTLNIHRLEESIWQRRQGGDMEIVRAPRNLGEVHYTHQKDLWPFHLQSCPLQVAIGACWYADWGATGVFSVPYALPPRHRLDNEINSCRPKAWFSVDSNDPSGGPGLCYDLILMSHTLTDVE